MDVQGIRASRTDMRVSNLPPPIRLFLREMIVSRIVRCPTPCPKVLLVSHVFTASRPIGIRFKERDKRRGICLNLPKAAPICDDAPNFPPKNPYSFHSFRVLLHICDSSSMIDPIPQEPPSSNLSTLASGPPTCYKVTLQGLLDSRNLE